MRKQTRRVTHTSLQRATHTSLQRATRTSQRRVTHLHIVNEHVPVQRVQPPARRRRSVVGRVDAAQDARVTRCENVSVEE